MQHFGVCKKRAFGIPMPLPKLLNDKYRQAVRIMKITAFILLVGTLHVSAGGFSQSITLSVKEESLTKVFKAIEKQTDYIFFYNVDWVKKIDKVNVDVKDMQLQQVLDLLFKNLPITYSITGKMITVVPKKDEKTTLNEGVLTPPIDIHGRVVDENGKPIAGVTVTVKGTKKQTITNDFGEFTISDVEDNAVLSFSSVNMEPFTVNVGGQKEIVAKLKTKMSELDEVQIIAYGQTTKRFQTGNVTTVKSEAIEQQPVQNPLLALQGRVPGLEVTQITGMPGGAVTVRIQGRNSINSGLQPLVVVDGVPYPTSLSNSLNEGVVAGGSPFNYINPGDIESIEVLKDADATAIYGSRAANGAILITTKKGKVGKPKLDINLQQGWGKVARKVNMMNTHQYLDMRYEAFNNDGIDWRSSNVRANDLKIWDTTRYTDWQKTLIGGSAQYTNVNVTMSGGSPLMQYLVGGTYNRQTTVFPTTYDDRKGSVHFNINCASANQKLKIQLSNSFMMDENHLPNLDLTEQALNLAPNAPSLYNSDGSLNWAINTSGNGTWDNPLAYVKYYQYNNSTKNLVSSASLSYNIYNGLELKTNLGYTNILSKLYLPTMLEVYRPQDRPYVDRTANYVNRTMTSWIAEPQLVYKGNLSKGKIEGLLGITVLKNSSDVLSLTGTGYSSDLVMRSITSATAKTVEQASYAEYKYNATFGRLNYNWNDKYIMNLTGRRDGSSRFGDKNKFHNFGSIGGAWIFSQEKLIREALPFLSYGKVRSSYGNTGNDQIPDYSYLSLYTYIGAGIPYQNSLGTNAYNISNPYLQWEETRKWQSGIELGFLNDRIVFNGTYARNRSSNQLISYALPLVTGFGNITENFPATIQNISWEFLITSVNVKSRKVNWTSSFNLTIPRNKLLSFPNIDQTTYASGFNGVIVGQPLGVSKTYHYGGVNSVDGLYQVNDKNGNSSSAPNFPDDYNILINAMPKFYGGFENSLSFKGIRLDFLFQFVQQKGPKQMYYYNESLEPGRFSSNSSNQPTTVLNRWQKPGDNTPVAKYTTMVNNVFLWPTDGSNTWYSYEASYIRLKNLSISWQVPENWQRKLHLQSAKIYFRGQNLATITKFTGLDPETKSTTTLPPLRILTFGLQAEL